MHDRVRGTRLRGGGGSGSPGVDPIAAERRSAILRERFERGVQEGDLPKGTDCVTLARLRRHGHERPGGSGVERSDGGRIAKSREAGDGVVARLSAESESRALLNVCAHTGIAHLLSRPSPLRSATASPSIRADVLNRTPVVHRAGHRGRESLLVQGLLAPATAPLHGRGLGRGPAAEVGRGGEQEGRRFGVADPTRSPRLGPGRPPGWPGGSPRTGRRPCSRPGAAGPATASPRRIARSGAMASLRPSWWPPRVTDEQDTARAGRTTAGRPGHDPPRRRTSPGGGRRRPRGRSAGRWRAPGRARGGSRQPTRGRASGAGSLRAAGRVATSWAGRSSSARPVPRPRRACRRTGAIGPSAGSAGPRGWSDRDAHPHRPYLRRSADPFRMPSRRSPSRPSRPLPIGRARSRPAAAVGTAGPAAISPETPPDWALCTRGRKSAEPTASRYAPRRKLPMKSDSRLMIAPAQGSLDGMRDVAIGCPANTAPDSRATIFRGRLRSSADPIRTSSLPQTIPCMRGGISMADAQGQSTTGHTPIDPGSGFVEVDGPGAGEVRSVKVDMGQGPPPVRTNRDRPATAGGAGIVISAVLALLCGGAGAWAYERFLSRPSRGEARRPTPDRRRTGCGEPEGSRRPGRSHQGPLRPNRKLADQCKQLRARVESLSKSADPRPGPDRAEGRPGRTGYRGRWRRSGRRSTPCPEARAGGAPDRGARREAGRSPQAGDRRAGSPAERAGSAGQLDRWGSSVPLRPAGIPPQRAKWTRASLLHPTRRASRWTRPSNPE